MHQPIDIVPTSVHARVEQWNEQWRFAQPDSGRVSFDVQKECGLVITVCNAAGAPQDGYAVVIDQRGSNNFIDWSDRNMSTSYISSILAMDTPLNSTFGLARNVELCMHQLHHIDLAYHHGSLQVAVDGRKILDYNDTMANPGMRYVGFGSTGLASGPGRITNLRVQ